MIRLPRRLATPVSDTAILRNKTTLDAVKLKSTKVKMNFQKQETSGLSPASPYTIDPSTNGGITRRGSVSKTTFEMK